MSLSQLTVEAGKDPNETTAKNFGPLLKYSPDGAEEQYEFIKLT
jgi:hypothetical protein